MSSSIIGRIDVIGVVGLRKLYFLHNMTERHPIHLRYALVDFIAHQRKHVHLNRISTVLCILRLMPEMRLMEQLEG